MPDQNCSHCDEPLTRPYETNANYVKSDSFQTETETEVNIAYIHTNETKKRLNELDDQLPNRDRDEISASIARPGSDDTIEIPNGEKDVTEEEGALTMTSDVKEIPFGMPSQKFETRRIENPNEIANDDDIAYVETQTQTVTHARTGVVCPGCTPDDAEIIWGVDK